MTNGMLNGKTAIVYGGGGAIGGAVARAFARNGARVFLVGRSLGKLEVVANDIAAHEGNVAVASLDVLDEAAVRAHAEEVVATSGGIDIAFNAIGILHLQGTPFLELSLDEYLHPITSYARANFVTAQAVAKHMMRAKRGVILSMSTNGSLAIGAGFIGFGVACATIEGFARKLAAEVGPSGVRVVCLRSNAIPEATAIGSHSATVFSTVASRNGITIDQLMEQNAKGTLLGRLPTLAETANAAVFFASDQAGAMTGVIANLTAGALVD